MRQNFCIIQDQFFRTWLAVQELVSNPSNSSCCGFPPSKTMMACPFQQTMHCKPQCWQCCLFSKWQCTPIKAHTLQQHSPQEAIGNVHRVTWAKIPDLRCVCQEFRQSPNFTASNFFGIRLLCRMMHADECGELKHRLTYTLEAALSASLQK